MESEVRRVMARYVSAENRFDCFQCHIWCTVREMKERECSGDGFMHCPNCDQMILYCPTPMRFANG